MKDFFGREYKVGDYVFCAVTNFTTTVTFVGKVVKINPQSISVLNYWTPYARNNISLLKVTERHMIISEELALEKEPRLKDI